MSASRIKVLETRRLILRPIVEDDAPDFRAGVALPEIALMTASIPHPYPDGMEYEVIDDYIADYAKGAEQRLCLAIAWKTEPKTLMGVASLFMNAGNELELGYWLHPDYWGNDITKEAAQAMLAHGFASWPVDYIRGHTYRHNMASSSILQTLGFELDGTSASPNLERSRSNTSLRYIKRRPQSVFKFDLTFT